MPTYMCPRFPVMRIRHLSFVGGNLTVQDPEDVKLVESNDWFRVYIFPVPTMDTPPPPPPPAGDDQAGRTDPDA